VIALLWLATSGHTWRAWLDGAWEETDELERHIFYTIIACMLKDGLLFKLELNQYSQGIAMHHIMTVVGCSLCLVMPVGRGWVTLNAWVAEIGSAAYVVYKLYPHLSSKLLYVLLMTGSNVLCCWNTYCIAQLELPHELTVIYVALVVGIVGLRAAAQVLEVVNWFSEAANESGRAKVA